MCRNLLYFERNVFFLTRQSQRKVNFENMEGFILKSCFHVGKFKVTM